MLRSWNLRKPLTSQELQDEAGNLSDDSDEEFRDFSDFSDVDPDYEDRDSDNSNSESDRESGSSSDDGPGPNNEAEITEAEDEEQAAANPADNQLLFFGTNILGITKHFHLSVMRASKQICQQTVHL
ncbi:hypothetical protein NQ314_008628 [Rhamnusium bicolor]|uniref:Uncharacterized protein n=1 Tax=Rhamnusium bicolor TaxID=1586634 RepID=A0AAV8YAI0_9CUCU|nr:hypothetical protein NQ314_008628 [Rhamnusium bicolor]